MTSLWGFDEPIELLRELLSRGGILGIPTESSYGLAVDPRNADGVAAIYRVKERERGKPLPVVAADVAQLAALGVDVDDPGVRRAVRVWPAALTVASPIAASLPAAAGELTLAVRIPDHAQLLDLLRALGPLTATSANRSGEPPLLASAPVAELLAGEDAMVVDGGGALAGGPPSTLVAWVDGDWNVLRQGRFPLGRLPR
jgi:L-threonylcarbamoyladenylate synthase